MLLVQRIFYLSFPVLIALACSAADDNPEKYCATPIFSVGSHAKALPWPSDIFTVADPSSLTGVRLFIDPANPPNHDLVFTKYGPKLIEGLNTLDGFSTYAQMAIEFNGILEPDSLPDDATATTLPGSPVYLIDTDPASPDYGDTIPVETVYFPNIDQLFLRPIYPLRAKTRYGYLLTTTLKGNPYNCTAAGGCMADTLTKILAGETGGTPLHFAEGVRELVRLAGDKFGVTASQLTLAVSFTTQSITEEMVALRDAEIARAANERIFDPASLTSHESSGGIAMEIEGILYEADYRNEEGVIVFGPGLQPPQPTIHEVRFYLTIPHALPDEGIEQPYPVMLYQHGMNSSHSAMYGPAHSVGAAGYALIGIDAVEHGERRSYDNDDYIEFLNYFFGLFMTADGFYTKPLLARDNWRTITVDHFQVLNLVEQLADYGLDMYRADGDGPLGSDGIIDIDPDTIVLSGTSMGGITGGLTYPYEPRIRNCYLNVPSAGLSNIIFYFTGVPMAEAMLNFLDPSWDIRRFIGIYQMFLDRGDPINVMRHVFAEPLGDNPPRSLLFQMADDDMTLPNRTTGDMALAAGMPLLEPVTRFLPYLERQSIPSGGLKSNVADGITAGLYQFEYVTSWYGGDPTPAGHGNVVVSAEGVEQAIEFLNSELETGVANIIDPYRE